ncbi:N-acetylglucosaminidase [Mechercharimyces sp. CAU 1602]|uniref:N-acetylglucosaminidase n=1 Tax=Mechercharimyces sp. CAU 1602 TaxID=2973933 RepID=UPI002163332E|nr:glucosaminidase domain-containing protein [Mechercharimyces sp. CAU 1602]MCS1350365.1 glucosaminidase domain-containing protein [Mechercharimyces sp. CAU 1602]
MSLLISEAVSGRLNGIQATTSPMTYEEALDTQANLQWPPIIYKDGGWHQATPEEVDEELNPANSLEGDEVLQHLNLAQVPDASVADLDDFLEGQGVLEGMGVIFLAGGLIQNVDPIYLAVHSSLESGRGTSKLATGTVEGYEGWYNVFGIGAIDENPNERGAQYAKEKGWDSAAKAIYGGIKWISYFYIHAGQNTLYKMKWNPKSPGDHQYATDIGWSRKQATRIASHYRTFGDIEACWDLPNYAAEEDVNV